MGVCSPVLGSSYEGFCCFECTLFWLHIRCPQLPHECVKGGCQVCAPWLNRMSGGLAASVALHLVLWCRCLPIGGGGFGAPRFRKVLAVLEGFPCFCFWGLCYDRVLLCTVWGGLGVSYWML